MTKQIEVHFGEKSLYATVDDVDYEYLSHFTWKTQIDQCNVYAAAQIRGKKTLMHREIMGNPHGKMVDHRDGNGLNNVRSNLRVCTNSQNQFNSKLRRTSRSGYKGVCLRGEKIASRIKVNGVSIFLGYFDTIEAAARAYNEAAVEYHGEFARLNDV